jgi:hypothetical protein
MPQFYEANQPVEHPLEKKFNASAWDILSAVERGFRAQVDVKGKLAEWFLFKILEEMRAAGTFTAVDWTDEDSKPDFHLVGPGFDLRLECKNLRSPSTRKGKAVTERYKDGSYKLETQKTRSQKSPTSGTQGAAPKENGTRLYKVTEFDVVAACLFNQTGKWEYYFTRTTDLERDARRKNCLKAMQKVPPTPRGIWKATLNEVLDLFTAQGQS